MLDFGRLYLGYVNAQSIARIAANYAANNATKLAPIPDAAVLAEYRRLVGNDARQINCQLPDPVPGPVFASGTDLGDPATVSIPCRFLVLTPLISVVVGDDVLITASATFPVTKGAVTNVNNGTPPTPAPVASFLATPLSGFAPLTVNFYDVSENAPTSWVWDFGDGSTGLSKNETHVYDTPGKYTISLTVSNSGGTDSDVQDQYVEVLARPTTDPVADFTADVQVGPKPLAVTFTDASTGSPTSWLWGFGDGSTSTSQSPSHTFTSAGTFDVSLTVTSATGTNTQVKKAFVRVSQLPCVVPNFANTASKDAQTTWKAAGFATSVSFLQKGNYTLNYQSLPGGLTNPPNGCDAVITVGP